MTTKLILSLKSEVSCDEFLNHVNGLLKEAPVKLPNFLLDIGFESIELLSAETCSVSSPASITPSPSVTKIEPTVSPTTEEPTSSPSAKPTRAPIIGTFPPTKATPSPTNVPTKSPTPGPTCVAIESFFEEVLDGEVEDNEDDLTVTLECPKDVLDLVVLASTGEEDGDCVVTCLGHVAADAVEGGCANNEEEEYSVILQTEDLDLDTLTLFIGYVDKDLPQDLDCPEESLVLATVSPTRNPTLSPTTVRSTIEDLLLESFDTLNTDALTWLTEIDSWLPSEESKTTVVTGPNGEDQSLWKSLWVERYALAVLYYETNGGGWTNDEGWLSNQSVCNWWNRKPTACNAMGQIIRLDLCMYYQAKYCCVYTFTSCF